MPAHRLSVPLRAAAIQAAVPCAVAARVPFDAMKQSTMQLLVEQGRVKGKPVFKGASGYYADAVLAAGATSEPRPGDRFYLSDAANTFEGQLEEDR
jgi:hypothetical protein